MADNNTINPRNRTVTLNDDIPRRLRFDHNAMANAEEALGKSFGEIMTGLGTGKFSFSVVRALLWAGINSGSKRKFAIERIGELMSGCDTIELMTVAISAITLDFPEFGDDETEKAVENPTETMETRTVKPD